VILPAVGYIPLTVWMAVRVGGALTAALAGIAIVGFSSLRWWVVRFEDRQDAEVQAAAGAAFSSPAAMAMTGYPKGTLSIDASAVRWTPSPSNKSPSVAVPVEDIDAVALAPRGWLTPRATFGISVGSTVHVFLTAARFARAANNEQLNGLL